jgi:exosortase K
VEKLGLKSILRIKKMLPKKELSNRITLLGCYGLTVLIMWLLKFHYSRANAESLGWMLNPVAAMVQLVDGLDYAWHSGIGWVRSDGYITIAPACAGVNFMIMLFGLSCAAFLHRLERVSHRLAWLASAMAAAYLIAVCVNSIRIMVSIFLYEHHLSWGWLTAQRLHRGIGVAVYFPVLGLYYLLLQRIMDRLYDCPHMLLMSLWFPWQPLIWYISGTVIVPFLHSTYKGMAGVSGEYAATVIGVSLLGWIVGSMGWNLLRKRKIYASRCPDRGR